MLTAPSPLNTFLSGTSNTAFFADLLTITLLDGTTYRWTSAPVDVVDSGNTFRTAGANGPMVFRSFISQGDGLSIDTLDVAMVGGSYAIGGKSLTQLAVAGWFDGARIQLDRLVMPAPGDLSLGAVSKWFEGRVSMAEPEGPKTVLRCKDEKVTLNQTLPLSKVQAACNWVVYDSNCGLSKAAFTLTGTVAVGTSATQFTTASAAIIAKATGYFDLGVLTFTSGALTGQSQDVLSWTSGSSKKFVVELPFSSAPAPGDAFSVYPGCDRQRATCASTGSGGKFNNLIQFRGYPHIPAKEGAK
jgi:uncharacterized phage protein (TIGR02218 family)